MKLIFDIRIVIIAYVLWFCKVFVLKNYPNYRNLNSVGISFFLFPDGAVLPYFSFQIVLFSDFLDC